MSMEERKHVFTWKIENLSFFTQRKCECIRSPIFKAESLYESSWCLTFYPRGSKNSEEGWAGCHMTLCGNEGPSELECGFKIKIFGPKGNILFSDLSSVLKFEKGEEWGWRKIFKTSVLTNNNQDLDDFITVLWEVTGNLQAYPLRSESSSITKIVFNQYSFKWIMRNANSDSSEVINFPCTAVKIDIQISDDDIKIAIIRANRQTESQSVSCKVSLLDVAGTKQDSRQALHLFEGDASVENDTWVFPTFLKKSKLNAEKEKYLADGCFTLQFEIKLSSGEHSEPVECKVCDSFTYVDTPISNNLIEDMKRLYVDKIQADIELHVENKTILAHKSILSIRSPVFFAMFNSEMTENKTSSVDIPDLETETVNSLLEYMYTGRVENLDCEVALKLLTAADKYQVLPLKETCANFLKSSLIEANVCDVLVVADMVKHEALKDFCVSFIKDNSESVFFSDEWKLVIESNLQLAMRTVTEVSKLLAIGQKKNDGK